LEITAKGFDTMPKGFGNRWWPSVHEEKSEFDRVAPQGDPGKGRPTRPSLTVFASAFPSANHKPLINNENKTLTCSRASRKKLVDYVIRRFNLSSARLNKPQGLDLR